MSCINAIIYIYVYAPPLNKLDSCQWCNFLFDGIQMWCSHADNFYFVCVGLYPTSFLSLTVFFFFSFSCFLVLSFSFISLFPYLTSQSRTTIVRVRGLLRWRPLNHAEFLGTPFPPHFSPSVSLSTFISFY